MHSWGNDLRQKYGAKNKNKKQSFMFNLLKKRAAVHKSEKPKTIQIFFS